MVFLKDKLKNGFVARSGTQKYLGEEIGELKGKVYNVVRPKSVVESLKDKLKGVPVTYGHVDFNEASLKERKRGVVESAESTDIRGETHLRAKMQIDSDVEFLQENSINELSLGYEATLEKVDNNTFKLTNVEPHHLAVVPTARGGQSLKFLDEGKKMTDLNDIENAVSKAIESKSLYDEQKKMKDELDNFRILKKDLEDSGIEFTVKGIKEFIKKSINDGIKKETENLLDIYKKAQDFLPKDYKFSEVSKMKIINDALTSAYPESQYLKGFNDDQKIAAFLLLEKKEEKNKTDSSFNSLKTVKSEWDFCEKRKNA